MNFDSFWLVRDSLTICLFILFARLIMGFFLITLWCFFPPTSSLLFESIEGWEGVHFFTKGQISGEMVPLACGVYRRKQKNKKLFL